ncbi:hypothetical protein [Paenibacillus sp. J2TS4]|uniref:hypothetical protein n=1 Tax=Paenibacillus sp. J2TS4 TaxID=2807194 RepID=UPI001B1BFB23|nr:hypothetical protein [Paenibacillus sp. J2TS4]GIP32361.1 hypothetical protein J2TS4_15710 [Paenibacillus sp. J2TS4]
MRMASFLLGGIAGAAAVVYVSRNSDKVWSGIMRMAGSANQMMSQSKSMMNNLTSSPTDSLAGQGPAAAKSVKSSGGHNGMSKSQTSNYSMSDVEEIINKDSQLKATVQEILEHNDSQKSEFSPIRS